MLLSITDPSKWGQECQAFSECDRYSVTEGLAGGSAIITQPPVLHSTNAQPSVDENQQICLRARVWMLHFGHSSMVMCQSLGSLPVLRVHRSPATESLPSHTRSKKSLRLDHLSVQPLWPSRCPSQKNRWMPDRPWMQCLSVDDVGIESSVWTSRNNTNLLVRVHARKSASASLPTLRCCLLNLLLGTVGEVAGVVVAGHADQLKRLVCWYEGLVAM